jgi:general secretion pathway protein C
MKTRLRAAVLGPRLGLWLMSLAIWAAVAASASFWVLRVAATRALQGSLPAPGSVTATAPGAVGMPDLAAVARALGAAAAPAAAEVAAAPPVESRLRVLGIVASPRGGTGAALIAVDGQPPRPVRVGAEVEPGVVLVAVELRSVRLRGRDGTERSLPLPIAPPASSTASGVGGAAQAGAVPSLAPAQAMPSIMGASPRLP